MNIIFTYHIYIYIDILEDLSELLLYYCPSNTCSVLCEKVCFKKQYCRITRVVDRIEFILWFMLIARDYSNGLIKLITDE